MVEDKEKKEKGLMGDGDGGGGGVGTFSLFMGIFWFLGGIGWFTFVGFLEDLMIDWKMGDWRER